jgi:hypothetical protein
VPGYSFGLLFSILHCKKLVTDTLINQRFSNPYNTLYMHVHTLCIETPTCNAFVDMDKYIIRCNCLIILI